MFAYTSLFFSNKVIAHFFFRNNHQERPGTYFGWNFAPEDHVLLQLPNYCLLRQVAPICYDSSLIHHQLPWLMKRMRE